MHWQLENLWYARSMAANVPWSLYNILLRALRGLPSTHCPVQSAAGRRIANIISLIRAGWRKFQS
jgi:aminoglycoside phosphotransferase